MTATRVNGTASGPALARLLVVVSAIVLAAGCGDADGSGAAPASPAGEHAQGEILVFAAASLLDVFTEIEAAFESAHPGTRVEVTTAGSSALREQILQGAPADVFASADVANMDQVVDAGLAEGAPTEFAANELEIAVPAGNPGGVTGLEDLADGDLLVGLCAEGVPCGDLARQMLSAAGIEASVDTDEPDVRALLTKLEVGELDVGVVYVTDVRAADGAVEGITIPAEVNARATYPIVTLAESPNPTVASAFVEFVRSPESQAILADHGFSPP